MILNLKNNKKNSKKNLKEILVEPEHYYFRCFKIIKSIKEKCLIVVDHKQQFLGTNN